MQQPKDEARSPLAGSNLLLLIAVSLLAAPVEYIAHESAHYVVAGYFGATATLHFDRVTLENGALLNGLQMVLFAAAGPAVDWFVGVGAIMLLVLRYTPIRLALAVYVTRPLQFVPALLGVDLSGLGIAGGLGGTDEAIVARAVGVPPQVIVWTELAVAIPLLALIAIRIPVAYRLRILSILTIGVLSGWAGWLTWGSHVLP